jgi:hypothetical protein
MEQGPKVPQPAQRSEPRRQPPAEFQEIGHSGGQVTFRVVTDQSGRRSYQVGWRSARPVPAALLAIYALPQGIPVSPLPMGGIGSPWPASPIPGCFPVLIASDSEGMFGQKCPGCAGYWRARGLGTVCPYCGRRFAAHELLTSAQASYVKQYCDRLRDALDAEQDGVHAIDMDAVADAVGRETEKPAFYYAEESQQHKFTCEACGQINDILGTYGYCTGCGTRNDLQELEKKIIPALRDRINTGGPYEACVKDAVAAFDSFAGQYVQQLTKSPMTPRRRARLEKMRFHNLEAVATNIKAAFDIDILDGLDADAVDFTKKMFHRRHVYEHNGGEADEKYIADSGDTGVRPKQALRETQESANRLASLVLKIARNLHSGFHEIFPPEEQPIKWHQERQRAGAGKQ